MGVRSVASWMGGSPVAWISLGATAITTVGGIVYGYGKLANEVDSLRDAHARDIAKLEYQVVRNREEYKEKFAAHDTAMNSMYTTLSSIHSMRTDVEVIKSQVQTVIDAVKRIESAQRRGQTLKGH